MKCPEGLDIFLDKNFNDEDCLILDMAIYGLVQAACQFWKRFVEVLKNIGFEHSKTDLCLLKRITKEGDCYFGIYVDNNICIGNRKVIDDSIQELKKVFTLKCLGPIKEFIGCTIEKIGNEAFLSQPHILENIKKNFGELVKNNWHSYTTPVSPGMIVTRSNEEIPKLNQDMHAKYRSGIGMLMYLVKHSRPDLSNAT